MFLWKSIFLYVKRIHTTQQLAESITVWLKDTDASVTAGRIGQALIEENLGAVERTLVHLRKYV